MLNGRTRSLVVDDPKRCLFQVHRTAYTSPEILELERERVFDRSWIYVGHESEVRNPGDFQSRDAAGRPVILCRDSDGEIRILINSCTHRGAQLCRQAEGNAKTQAQNEAPLVRHHVAAKPLVRPQCLPHHLPQIWLGFFNLSLAHELMKLAPLPAQIEGNS